MIAIFSCIKEALEIIKLRGDATNRKELYALYLTKKQKEALEYAESLIHLCDESMPYIKDGIKRAGGQRGWEVFKSKYSRWRRKFFEND